MLCQAKLSISIGGDEPTWEGDVEVEFEYTPGAEATRLDPADPDEVEVLRVLKVNGRSVAFFDSEELLMILEHIEADDSLMEDLAEIGNEAFCGFLEDQANARARDREED